MVFVKEGWEGQECTQAPAFSLAPAWIWPPSSSLLCTCKSAVGSLICPVTLCTCLSQHVSQSTGVSCLLLCNIQVYRLYEGKDLIYLVNTDIPSATNNVYPQQGSVNIYKVDNVSLQTYQLPAILILSCPVLAHRFSQYPYATPIVTDESAETPRGQVTCPVPHGGCVTTAWHH